MYLVPLLSVKLEANQGWSGVGQSRCLSNFNSLSSVSNAAGWRFPTIPSRSRCRSLPSVQAPRVRSEFSIAWSTVEDYSVTFYLVFMHVVSQYLGATPFPSLATHSPSPWFFLASTSETLLSSLSMNVWVSRRLYKLVLYRADEILGSQSVQLFEDAVERCLHCYVFVFLSKTCGKWGMGCKKCVH